MENFMDRLYSKLSTGAGQQYSSNMEPKRREGGENKVDQLMGLMRENDSKQLECIAAMFNQEGEEREHTKHEILQAVQNTGAAAQGTQQAIQSMGAAVQDTQQSVQSVGMAVQDTQQTVQSMGMAVQDTQHSVQSMGAAVQSMDATLHNIADAMQQIQTEQSYEQEPQTTGGGITPEQLQDLEEHVHKENVKCYRNVQASVMEQAELQMEQTRSSVGSVKGMLITSLILNVATIAILIVHLLGVI